MKTKRNNVTLYQYQFSAICVKLIRARRREVAGILFEADDNKSSVLTIVSGGVAVK